MMVYNVQTLRPTRKMNETGTKYNEYQLIMSLTITGDESDEAYQFKSGRLPIVNPCQHREKLLYFLAQLRHFIMKFANNADLLSQLGEVAKETRRECGPGRAAVA